MDTILHLEKLEIFNGIPKEEIKRIAATAKDSSYEHSALLYTAKEEVEHIYVVKKGKVSLYHSRNGKRFIFDVVGPGGLFGNFSENSVRVTHSAEASAESRVCRFTIKDFLAVVSSHPEVMLRVLRIFAERINDYIEKFEAGQADATERVIMELHRNKKRQGLFFRVIGKGGCMELTHEEIGRLTGLNRVTVTRALQKLESDGEVILDGRGRVCLPEKV